MAGERVVVIDTNFVGAGKFRAEKVERFARRVADAGSAVVVPEVTVWEWAEHAHQQLEGHHRATKAASESVDLMLGSPLSPDTMTSVDELVERITAFLHSLPHVDIDPIPPNSAVDAIRQQVTQTGLGVRSRDGTKTGAADAGVLGIAQARRDAGYDVVVGTNDRLLGDALSAIGLPVVQDQRALWRTVRRESSAPTLELQNDIPVAPRDAPEAPFRFELAERMAQFIEIQTREELASNLSVTLLDEGADLHLPSDEAPRGWPDPSQTDLDLRFVNAVELVDIEVEFGPEYDEDKQGNEDNEEEEDDEDEYDDFRLVSGEARVQALIDITRWYVSPEDGQLVDVGDALDGTITVVVSVEFDDDWQPTHFETNGRARISQL